MPYWLFFVALILFGCDLSSRKKDPPPEETSSEVEVPDIKKAITSLEYTELVLGKGKKASWGDKVKISAELSYLGKKGPVAVESQKTLEFIIGKGDLIFCLEKGVVGMAQGGERRLVIPDYLAYGARGIPEKIPPSARLEAKIKLERIW